MKLKQASLVVAALAVAATPVLASAASDSEVTTINANVGSAITMTTSAAVELEVTPVGTGVQTIAADTVTINSNNTAGYTLGVKDTTGPLTLDNGGNTIAVNGGTFAAPVGLANNSWGFAVAGQAGHDATYTVAANTTTFTAKFAPMAATDSQIRNTSAPSTGGGDVTTVYYGVRVDTTKPTGTYTNGVTYTATTK